MKKACVLLVTLLLLASCSSAKTEKEQNADLRIVDAVISIGGVNNSNDKQKLNYAFTISNEGKLLLQKDSIQIMLNNWTRKKSIENKITEKNCRRDSISIKGYVIFSSKDVQKEEIAINEPLITGIKMKKENGKEVIVKYYK
ncbi:hypothetical protein [Bacillus sp. FJAT-49736]|uniref:hypothetical protein n=1 Tax=Bacillus sp. FJAT-49736 TaxID=2833582 RepID=UPI001BC9EEDF|nr:hypothetical protein [Bacillus sp. FJAT-49736]MBS4174504.1 hypothetical protein [Bacillus sp. FJAT-49736]